MNNDSVPTVASQFLTRRAVISAPLSERTFSGAPCSSMHLPSSSITCEVFARSWLILKRFACRDPL
jgi:hypothetical protein